MFWMGNADYRVDVFAFLVIQPQVFVRGMQDIKGFNRPNA